MALIACGRLTAKRIEIIRAAGRPAGRLVGRMDKRSTTRVGTVRYDRRSRVVINRGSRRGGGTVTAPHTTAAETGGESAPQTKALPGAPGPYTRAGERHDIELMTACVCLQQQLNFFLRPCKRSTIASRASYSCCLNCFLCVARGELFQHHERG